jgi:hypothetical protein
VFSLLFVEDGEKKKGLPRLSFGVTTLKDLPGMNQFKESDVA